MHEGTVKSGYIRIYSLDENEVGTESYKKNWMYVVAQNINLSTEHS